ncbi:unnamed protein product [Mesocestoides corti]|uniref:glutathione transferase n=2 Tax=Mesocestoides corti TaxID=53468 RepID=A0A0R3UQM8_MESCO|nr:unnamed protein product [Mesocestoides corti]
MKPVLVYWDIRGICESSRLLLRYLGEDFEEKRYKWGPAPAFDPREWLSVKYSLGLDFPNLPYLIDGDFKLTQSSAILEYIADKHGMIPACPARRAALHMLHNEVYDFLMDFGVVCYSPDFEKLKPGFLERASRKLDEFEKYLGENQWLTGDEINYPDFSLCEFLNQLIKFEPACLDNHPKLKAYLNRFESLPNIKDYMASSSFKSSGCNGATATWRGDG